MGINDRDLANFGENPKLIEAYGNYQLSMMRTICKLNPNFNQTILEMDIQDMLEFESKLAKAKLQLKTFAKMRLKHMVNQTGFDWEQMIVKPLWKIFNLTSIKQIESDDKVIITNLEYYAKTIDLLNKTSSRVVQNYMTWFVILQYNLGHIGPESLRLLAFQFNKFRYGKKSIRPRWRSCFTMVSDDLSWSLARLFIEKNYFTMNEKHNASKLTDSIQSAYIDLLNSNKTWLDRSTQIGSIRKIQNVFKNVAYPNWILNDTLLDQYYGIIDSTLLNQTENNFLIIYSMFLRLKLRTIYSQLPVKIDRANSWIFSPFIVNAGYYWTRNTLSKFR